MENPDRARSAFVDFLAKCDQAFHPFAPIELPEFFAGRIRHINRLQSEIDAPGRHVAIFGERGVGKTSLAKLAYFFLKRDEELTYYVPCHKDSTFDSIFADVLAAAGVEVVLNGMESDTSREGSLGLGSLSVRGARRVRRTYRRITPGRQITGRLLESEFKGREGLVILDEFDRVVDQESHTRLAELIKHFSDARSKTKIVIVGVAETLTALIGKHESLSRSLAQLKLDRMTDDELADIIAKGEAHLKTTFKSTIRRRIVRLADGFPYFVHLISRHAARAAGHQLLLDPNARIVVAEEEYAEGLRDAIENAQHDLPEQYNSAIVTTRRPSEKFTLVLWAMALSELPELQVKEIARNMAFFAGDTPKPGSFNWNLGELTGDHRSRALTKVREGYYKFTNPLMRPYIRSMMELQNIVYKGKQWEFPFMQKS